MILINSMYNKMHITDNKNYELFNNVQLQESTELFFIIKTER